MLSGNHGAGIGVVMISSGANNPREGQGTDECMYANAVFHNPHERIEIRDIDPPLSPD